MITRRHCANGTVSIARYSPCLTYRYLLRRDWGAGPVLVWVMLNPSTATEKANDPTIARCEARARRLGFGAVGIVNLFGLRETRPKVMLAHPAPVGPDNDATIVEAVAGADQVVAAWGNVKGQDARVAAVRGLLRSSGVPVYSLVMNASGHPRHPLYVADAQVLQRWDP